MEVLLTYTPPGLARLREFRPIGGPGEPAGAEPVVDAAPGHGAFGDLPTPGALQEPVLPIAKLATTVRMPSGSTVLLSTDVPGEGDADAMEREELVFLVTATAVTF
jgi:hypothetical protein